MAQNNPVNIPVNINTNAGTLREQLRQATQEAQRLQQAGQEGTAAFAQAVSTIAELRDQQDTLNRTLSAFDPGNRFNAFIGIARSASTAVQGVAGALSLVGAESDATVATLSKLQGIMAFTDALNGIGDLQDFWKGFVLQIKNSVGPINAATLSTKGLGLALKGLGIGLIVAAVAYLVTNFDELKDTFKDILPDTEGLGDAFDTLKAVFMGVGNAVLQYLITPIRVLIDLFKGDFNAAIGDLKKGFDVVGNVQAGYEKTRQQQAEEAERKLAESRIAGLEYGLKLFKQGSKEYIEYENQLADARVKAAKSGEDRLKAIQDRNILYAQRAIKAQDEADKKAEDARKKAEEKAKAAADKAEQERKAALEEIKKNREAALSYLAGINDNARQKELRASDDAYAKQINLANKYGQDTSKLTEAYKKQQEDINTKYDTQISDALAARNDKTLSSYQQKQQEINKFYDNLLKNATDKEKELIEQNRQNELAATGKLNDLQNQDITAQVNLTTVSSDNTASDKDSAEVAKQKVDAINAAELEAENAAFELKKAQLLSQNESIELLTAEHNAKIVELDRQRVSAQKALDDAQYGYKITTLTKVGDALGAFSELVGKQTAAGKALAIAQATINTYLAATEVLKNPTTIPEPYGTIVKIASMATVIATGLAQVKEIASVSVSGTSSSSSAATTAPSITSATAPSITAQSLGLDTSVQDVRVVNTEDTTIKAYVTDKDLQDSQNRTAFRNRLSTI